MPTRIGPYQAGRLTESFWNSDKTCQLPPADQLPGLFLGYGLNRDAFLLAEAVDETLGPHRSVLIDDTDGHDIGFAAPGGKRGIDKSEDDAHDHRESDDKEHAHFVT